MAAGTAFQQPMDGPSARLVGPDLERGAESALESLMARLDGVEPVRQRGSVSVVRGAEVEVRGLRLWVGCAVVIEARSGEVRGEVVGVVVGGGIVAAFDPLDGVGRGDLVRRSDTAPVIASEALLGRVVDGFGNPLDGGPPIAGQRLSLSNSAPDPLSRQRITEPLVTGVRVLDLMCPAARGQRLGIFGGSGVGKSTLLAMMARGTDADVNVVALIGERGREVREMVEDELGPEGLARSVVVVATSDQPAILRRRAGELAVRYAEFFAATGRDVLMLFDSLTRLAMAQRELGLAAGEPPTARGYTPSVFSLLPSLLERLGPRESGSITAYCTVLVEGDDMNDPIADAARSILDGHVVLDRRLAHRNQYPAVDPLASLSRLADRVTTPERMEAAGAIRRSMAAVEEIRDLLEVGAYAPGTNPAADAGLLVEQDVRALLAQRPDEQANVSDAWDAATAIAERVS